MPIDRRSSTGPPFKTSANTSPRNNPARVLRIYVLMLGLVFILFYEALEPGNWLWIAPADRPDRTTISAPPPIPLAESPVPSEEMQRKLAVVRDDSLQIRPAEQPLYWELLREGEQKEWGSADSALRPSYAEVMKNLPTLRGSIISVTGKLRRLSHYEVPIEAVPKEAVPNEVPNDGASRPLYEGWFFTSDSGIHPWVVQFLVPPTGVTFGDELDLPITVTGLLFKTYQYESKAGLSSAPLLITDRVRIDGPTAAPSPTRPRRWNLVPLAVLLFGLIVILRYAGAGMFAPLRPQRVRRAELPDRIQLPADPPLSVVKDPWEAGAFDAPLPNENSPSEEN